ncbi:MAG: TetR/AcrR family transcriptional regulator [Bacteroidales bacterium]|nr:TetR/AcrR family transcriptional regulator [Bacteroidales bacterium]
MTTELSERQQEIIEAAGRLLTSSGVGGLTIKNLAKEMKFSESAIYRHFASKEEIIIAMLTFLADSIEQRLAHIPGSADPEAKFKALFEEQFRFFNSHPHFVVAVFSDGLMKETEGINEAILKLINVKMKYLMPVIMEGQQKGVFTNAITTEELVHIIMGTFKLQMFKWRTANFQFDIQRNGENMIHSVLTLIKNKK